MKNPCPYNSTCIPDYYNDTFSCADNIDECETKTHLCHNNAFCTNTLGAYTCTCNSGFTGDGFKCGQFEISVKSDEHDTWFKVDGTTYKEKGDGVNLMYLNEEGSHSDVVFFDCKKDAGIEAMEEFIDTIPTGKIVLLAVHKKKKIPKYEKVMKVHEIGSDLKTLEDQKSWVLIGCKG